LLSQLSGDIWMFKKFKRYHFRMAVQAEIKAQTEDQELVNTLCDHPNTIDLIHEYWEELHREQGYTVKVAAFLTMFGVYALALQRNEVSLADKTRIAQFLDQANKKARNNHAFYTRYFRIFDTGRSALAEFCSTHGLESNN
jgi:hypothetical protein